MALSMLLLLSAALTCSSLATRIVTVDEPAGNRTQQPLAGCWGRTSFGGLDGCRILTSYDACTNRYVFDRYHNKFGACQWWGGVQCVFDYEHAMPPLLPEECDKGFIEQNIPGGYTKFYRDFCIEELCIIRQRGGWDSDEGDSDEGKGFWDQMRNFRFSYWKFVPYPEAVPGLPDRGGPWPQDYGDLRWMKHRLQGYLGWAQAIQERCPVPPAWTGVWWSQDLFADLIYSDGSDLYWSENQCRRR